MIKKIGCINNIIQMGQLYQEVNYVDGLTQGIYKSYHENVELESTFLHICNEQTIWIHIYLQNEEHVGS